MGNSVTQDGVTQREHRAPAYCLLLLALAAVSGAQPAAGGRANALFARPQAELDYYQDKLSARREGEEAVNSNAEDEATDAAMYVPPAGGGGSEAANNATEAAMYIPPSTGKNDAADAAMYIPPSTGKGGASDDAAMYIPPSTSKTVTNTEGQSEETEKLVHIMGSQSEENREMERLPYYIKERTTPPWKLSTRCTLDPNEMPDDPAEKLKISTTQSGAESTTEPQEAKADSKEITSANSKESTPANSKESTPANSKESTPANSKESTPANSKESTVANSKESTVANSKESTVVNSKETPNTNSKESTTADPKDEAPIISNEALQDSKEKLKDFITTTSEPTANEMYRPPPFRNLAGFYVDDP